MGWYHTCKTCGITEKGMVGCDCMTKEQMELIKKIIGYKIINTKMEESNVGTVISMELEKDSNVINISFGGSMPDSISPLVVEVEPTTMTKKVD
ncbi:MAG: hypothetical protein Edafosvirus17_2 [Edafosvirus sp.]|uniref:Uncharacterized protein n=1 Tax=Edafosvirus sp. TaxID=2487765 RepID=A0A3G4ZUE5_9VIRU|nr:MAG: hypothetical protein Edafosvirus17_2 [Edafosvirus sp.]